MLIGLCPRRQRKTLPNSSRQERQSGYHAGSRREFENFQLVATSRSFTFNFTISDMKDSMVVGAPEVLGRVVFAGILLADRRDGSKHTSLRFFSRSVLFVLLCPFRSVQLGMIFLYCSGHIV